MPIPKQYKSSSEVVVDLPDGGKIVLKSPTWKERINTLFSEDPGFKLKHTEHFDDIRLIIADEFKKIEEENKIIIEKNKDNKDGIVLPEKTLKVANVIKALEESHGIPKDAYKEFKIHEEYQSRLNILSFINRCEDSKGNEFTIESVDEFNELEDSILTQIMAGYYKLVKKQLQVNLKNLNGGTETSKTNKKQRRSKKEIKQA